MAKPTKCQETGVLIIDNIAQDCKRLFEEKNCFPGRTIECYNFSDIPLIVQYNNEDYSNTNVDIGEIKSTIESSLGNLLKKGSKTRWLVLFDYQICKGPDEDTHAEINDAIYEAVFNVLKTNNNVYLILYTAIDPEGLSTLYDDYYEKLLDPVNKAKMKLYYMHLSLFFTVQPENYMFIAKHYLSKELLKIDKGEASDEHWASAKKPFDD